MGLDDYHSWLRFLRAGLKFRSTQGLYNFTPADIDYGNKLDKMLNAELLNSEKIGVLTACQRPRLRRG